MDLSPAISDQTRWQAVLQEQKLANARRWLYLLETSTHQSSLVRDEYDNFLKALETSLKTADTFDIAYKLSQLLYPIIFGFADWDRWLVYLRQTLQTSQILGKQNEEARLIEQIGDLLHHIGNLNEAEKNYQSVALLYEKEENLISYSRTLAKLATLKDIQGNTDEGIHLCQKALATAEKAQDDLAQANANLSLANIYRRIRDREQALSTAQAAYTIYQRLGHSTLLTRASITLIAIWAEEGNWDQINDISKELMIKLNASGDVYNLSQLKNNMGISAYGQGNFILAEASWQEALHLHLQIQEPTELAGIYNNLGMVYTQLQEWKTAEEMLQKAIKAYKSFGDTFNWANSLDNLADLYEARGQTATFKSTLQEAVDGLQAIKETPHVLELLNYMRQRLGFSVIDA